MIHHADNLKVLKSFETESIDLIYLDPPFNTDTNWVGKNGAFRDIWRLDDKTEEDENELFLYFPKAAEFVNVVECVNGSAWKAYLVFLGVRLIEMRRVLKKSGSIYLHCDPTMGAPIKFLMDCIFGVKNFRNEIIWRCNSGISGFKSKSTRWCRNHDIILYYAKSIENCKFTKSTFVNAEGLSEKFHTVGTRIDDVWVDVMSMQYQVVSKKESQGYPTQKPLALVKRIIEASSKPGDIVLDPFCGSGTTLVAAKDLERKWIGIDLSEDAVKIAKKRIGS